jgi:hypothetical protein
MRTILIETNRREPRHDAMLSLLRRLFPECEIRVVIRGENRPDIMAPIFQEGR